MTACECRPNVIVFFTDQQRWDTAGVHGNPLDLTPNFDRMAGEGTFVANSFTCQPLCLPARASLQTGRFPTSVGCWNNSHALPLSERTIAHHFNDAGYATGYIGKWHLAQGGIGSVPAERRGGYGYWLASNVIELTSHPYDTVVYDNENQPIKLPGYRVDALTDAAIRFIDTRQRDPFMLFLSFLEPHQQNDIDSFPAPTGYAERYAGRWLPPDLAALGGTSEQHLPGYLGSIKRLDEALGRLREALESLDLWENTILLYTSDHGCHFKTRNSEYKRSCHESSIRVPTLLRGGPFEGGGRIDGLVSLVDLPPTLLDAAGLPGVPTMEGRSILPLVRGEAPDWEDEVLVQTSESTSGADYGRAIRTNRWKYGVIVPGPEPEAPGADEYTEAYLYDLTTDPYELDNLVGRDSLRDVADMLEDRLLEHIARVENATPRIVPASLGGRAV